MKGGREKRVREGERGGGGGGRRGGEVSQVVIQKIILLHLSV